MGSRALQVRDRSIVLLHNCALILPYMTAVALICATAVSLPPLQSRAKQGYYAPSE